MAPRESQAVTHPSLAEEFEECAGEESGIRRIAERLFDEGWTEQSRHELSRVLAGQNWEWESAPLALRAFVELHRDATRHDRFEDELTMLVREAFQSADAVDLLELARRRLPRAVFSRIAARAASDSTTALTTRAQLQYALESATPDETVQIVSRIENSGIYDLAWETLNDRRGGVSKSLLGVQKTWAERLFGPTLERFLFGPAGLAGFPGVGAAVLSVFTLWMTGLQPAWGIGIFSLLFFGTRALLWGHISASFTPDQLLAAAARPSSAGLLFAWACRSRLEEGVAPPVEYIQALRSVITEAPPFLLERSRAVSSVLERELVHTAPRLDRGRLVEAVRDFEQVLHRQRRLIAGVSQHDTALIASALRMPESRPAALRALARAKADPKLVEACLDTMAGQPESLALWHYGLRAQLGGGVRNQSHSHNLHQSFDNALASLARTSSLGGELRCARLVWTSGELLSVDAHRAFMWLLEHESRSTHCVELFDLATHLDVESKTRALESLGEEAMKFAVACFGTDAQLYELGRNGGEDAALMLRRNAGPAAALGLWNLANTGTSRERRQAWTALEELAERYDYPLFELVDESVAAVRELPRDSWQELARSRLIQAMVGRRRWKPRAWRRAIGRPEFLEHARGLVWASMDLYGRVLGTFHIDESLELVDLDHEQWRLQGHHRVGIPSAVDLESGLLEEWSQWMADFEIVAPFEQLALAHTPERDYSSRAFRTLAQTRWLASHPDDERVFSFLRPFFELDATAIVEIEPGLGEHDEEQRVEHVGFIDGVHFDEPAVPVFADEEADPEAFSTARQLILHDIVRAEDQSVDS